jgi:hypothetical protein
VTEPFPPPLVDVSPPKCHPSDEFGQLSR